MYFYIAMHNMNITMQTSENTSDQKRKDSSKSKTKTNKRIQNYDKWQILKLTDETWQMSKTSVTTNFKGLNNNLEQ